MTYMTQMENFYLRDTIMETNDTTNKNWYVIEINTPKNFKKLRGMVNSVMPKGCSVIVTSQNRFSSKQRKCLKKSVFLSDYLFVLCDYEKHMAQILDNIEALGIRAEVLIDQGTNEPIVLNEADQEWLFNLYELTRDIDFIDEEFSIGDKIRAIDSPMKGFVGHISALTPERVYSTIQINNNTLTICFRREDLVKEED